MNIRVFLTLFFLIAGLVFGTGGVVLAVNVDADVEDVAISADTMETEPQVLVIGLGRAASAKFLSETVTLTNANSAVWANAFSTTATITAPGCISLRYSGEALATGALPRSFQFRAIIGGVIVNNPYVFFDPSNNNLYDLAAFNWWRCGLPAGVHNVLVQFKPFAAAHTASVRQRTLIIEY
jgi:hypothetical protein